MYIYISHIFQVLIFCGKQQTQPQPSVVTAGGGEKQSLLVTEMPGVKVQVLLADHRCLHKSKTCSASNMSKLFTYHSKKQKHEQQTLCPEINRK